ncbi:MAG: hypothetical protein J7497_00015 [Chitinophagaceae bacterium]|nr:hypothetical protein [Chitinophagaceae bacterium]
MKISAVKYIIFFLGCVFVNNNLQSQDLFNNVKKYVGFGVHRTGTAGDIATSAWLGEELKSYGYNVKYLEFSTRQFFPEKVYLASKHDTITAFPMWWVNENISSNVTGKLVDPNKVTSFAKNNIALIQLPDPKRTYGQNAAYIDSLIDKGISGIVVITNNPSEGIQAYNTSENAKPWRVPIILVAPRDNEKLRSFLNKSTIVTLAINGTFKDVKGRNVYGTIGNGKKYIVVSTPISGWFTCGGERGSGIAIWLNLAKFIAKQHEGYTYVFTGNSGHENAFYGAHQFLESEAPPIDKTHLWLHIGAGAATLKYTKTPSGLVKTNEVDDKRRFFYSDQVKESFTTAFKDTKGEKVLANENPGGELAYVARKGYKRFAGITHVHPFFHVETDDENTTSEDILESTASAFKDFLGTEAGINNNISFTRFDKNPIITADMLGEEGDNINGPSLLKTPDWLKNKLGKYYLYFAHHKGKYIRLAYADDLKGPWKIYEPGTLQLNDCRCKDGPAKTAASVRHEGAENAEDQVTHVASPDVHIDSINKQLVMYFHCPLTHRGKKGQYSLRAVSKDGIHFKADTTILGVSYFRVFKWKDNYYSIARNSKFSRSKDGIYEFKEGPNSFNKVQNPSTLRHAAVKLVNDTLYVFYSRVGDSPERILLSTIKLTDDWSDWTPSYPVTVAQPETDYEGADLPITPSDMGLYYGKARQLRDPYVFEDNGKWYLLYTCAGENAIGIGEINAPFTK